MSSRAERTSKARSVGRPPGATGEATRAEILDAALEAFAEAGFEAMSVRELTRRLEVPPFSCFNASNIAPSF